MASALNNNNIPQPYHSLAKEPYETEKHFNMRVHVYDEAVKAGLDHERAIVLCNVFKNAYFMGCSYPEEVMEESKKFWPHEALANPIYEEDKK